MVVVIVKMMCIVKILVEIFCEEVWWNVDWWIGFDVEIFLLMVVEFVMVELLLEVLFVE